MVPRYAMCSANVHNDVDERSMVRPEARDVCEMVRCNAVNLFLSRDGGETDEVSTGIYRSENFSQGVINLCSRHEEPTQKFTHYKIISAERAPE